MSSTRPGSSWQLSFYFIPFLFISFQFDSRWQVSGQSLAPHMHEVWLDRIIGDKLQARFKTCFEKALKRDLKRDFWKQN